MGICTCYTRGACAEHPRPTMPVDPIPRSDAAALLARLRSGGRIVSTAALTVEEIAAARADGRMWVDDENVGYVWLPDAGPLDAGRGGGV